MIIQADARKIPLADESVQCVVTSPPYWGLRDYGIGGQLGLERTPEEYVANMVVVFREVRRVLKDDGTLWLNLGDSYIGGGRGFREEDSSKQATNYGSLLIAPTRGVKGFKPKDLVGIPWRVAFALQADGWYLRSDIIWSKPNPMPESVTDRPTKAHEYLFLMAKSARYFYDADAIREPATFDPNGVRGYREGNIDNAHKPAEIRGDGITFTGRNRRTVWNIATQPWSGAHFATFPEKLVEPCILAGSRTGDFVLDPFVGSGTVVRVATRFQRKGVGCDLNLDYLEKQADKRMRNVQVELLCGSC